MTSYQHVLPELMCIKWQISVSPPEWLFFSQKVMDLISTALSCPLCPIEDNTEQMVCQTAPMTSVYNGAENVIM